EDMDKYPAWVRVGVCIWCRGEFARPVLTWDHIWPLSLGGPQKGTNLASACRECNQTRARITSAFGLQKQLQQIVRRGAPRTPRQRTRLLRTIRKFTRSLPAVQELQRQWIALELERLGYSPSAAAVLRAVEVD